MNINKIFCRPLVWVSLLVIFSAPAANSQEAAATKQRTNVAEPVKKASLGSTKNVHQTGKLFLAGQFSADDIAEIKKANIKRVITLRTKGEIDWDERQALKDEGIELIEIPFRAPESLTDEVFEKTRKLLNDLKQPTLLHCGSANRVGGVWLPFRVLDQNVKLETAVKEAEQVGLRTPFIKQKASEYIQRQQEKSQSDDSEGSKKGDAGRGSSVKPGINDSYLDPKLDAQKFVERFEVESREIFSQRHEIVEACGVQPGDYVADIGSGTGLFTRLFSQAVGETGWVYAIDVSPRLIEYVNQSLAKHRLENVTSILCEEDDINLPPNSVDVVYVCDTYHHFEYPQATMASIYRALKKEGRLIVIDFERIEGVSREFVMGHVRAGKQVFRAEIQDSGFSLQREVLVNGLKENYFLVFHKS